MEVSGHPVPHFFGWMVRENVFECLTSHLRIEVEYETSDEEDESSNDDSVVNYIHLL